MAPRTVTREAELAYAFLATLSDPRQSWNDLYLVWAKERGLDEATARTVKTTVLRIRVFGALERSSRRAARAR